MRNHFFVHVVIFLFFFSIIFFSQQVLADHSGVIIKVGNIYSETCEEHHSCFTPNDVSLDIGSEVTWINESHVSLWLILEPQNNSNKERIETGQIRPGNTYSFISNESVEYYFYAREQPWANGIITFEDEQQEKTQTIPKTTKKIIPEWIKNNAKWWVSGEIDDISFLQGIEFLIKEKILQVSVSSSEKDSESSIPSWIKSNAEWWSEDLISNDDFLKGIEYLVENGIINVGNKF